MAVLMATPDELWQLLEEYVGDERFSTDKMLTLMRDDELMERLDKMALYRRGRQARLDRALAEVRVVREKITRENRQEIEALRAELANEAE